MSLTKEQDVRGCMSIEVKRSSDGDFWDMFLGCPENTTVSQHLSPTCTGKRNVGHPKTTWHRTMEKERTMAGWKSWEKVRALAKDRDKWKKSSVVLCATERRG